MRNPLSKEAFAEWCEKQPAQDTYCYQDSGDCAFCQYLRAVGFPDAGVVPGYWMPNYRDGSATMMPLPDDVERAVYASPHTFADLAQRLRAA